MIARAEEELRADINGAFFIRAHMDWRVPVEMQFLFVVLRLGFNAYADQRVAVDPANRSALGLRIDIIRVCRVFEYPESVAAVDVLPARIRNASGIRRISNPRAVVLQPAVYVVRVRVVHAYVIELCRWQVPGPGPAGATVHAGPETAVVPGINLVGIGRVNPYRVIVAMRVGCGAEAASSIQTDQQ